MILIKLDFCDANILLVIIERGQKKYPFLLFQMICGCIVWEMIVLDKLTLSDIRTVFPDIYIFLERVFTVELLLKGFLLLASSIIHYMERVIIEFHPLCGVFLVYFFVHLRNNKNLVFPNSSFFQTEMKLRNFIVVIATKPLNCITEFLSVNKIRTVWLLIERFRPIYVLIHHSAIVVTVLQ